MVSLARKEETATGIVARYPGVRYTTGSILPYSELGGCSYMDLNADMAERDDETGGWARNDRQYIIEKLDKLLMDVQELKTSLQWMRGLSVILVPFALGGVINGIIVYARTETLTSDVSAHRLQSQEQWEKAGSRETDRFTKLMELDNRLHTVERNTAYIKQVTIEDDEPQIRRGRR